MSFYNSNDLNSILGVFYNYTLFPVEVVMLMKIKRSNRFRYQTSAPYVLPGNVGIVHFS